MKRAVRLDDVRAARIPRPTCTCAASRVWKAASLRPSRSGGILKSRVTQRDSKCFCPSSDMLQARVEAEGMDYTEFLKKMKKDKRHLDSILGSSIGGPHLTIPELRLPRGGLLRRPSAVFYQHLLEVAGR